jgi:hypothetical protein
MPRFGYVSGSYTDAATKEIAAQGGDKGLAGVDADLQESYDLIRIQLVQGADSELSRDEIERRFTEAFSPVLNNEFQFEYEWLDEIPSDPNGKLRMIVSKVK